MLHQNGFKPVLNERIHALDMIYAEKRQSVTLNKVKSGRKVGAQSRDLSASTDFLAENEDGNDEHSEHIISRINTYECFFHVFLIFLHIFNLSFLTDASSEWFQISLI